MRRPLPEAGALRRIKETSGKCWAEWGEITVDLGQVGSGAFDMPGEMLAWGQGELGMTVAEEWSGLAMRL